MSTFSFTDQTIPLGTCVILIISSEVRVSFIYFLFQPINRTKDDSGKIQISLTDISINK